MAEPFKDRDEIELWLRAQPSDVISVFLARVALRAVPIFANLIGNKNARRSAETIVLPCLWSISTALSAGIWPNRGVELYTAAAAASMYTTDNLSLATFTDDAVAYAAAAAARAVAYTAAGDVTVFRGSVTASAAAAGRAATYTEYSLDRDLIESGQTAKDLVNLQLWNEGSYIGNLPFDFYKDWQQLKSYLISLNPDWSVWTKWYEARLEGLPLIEEIEIGLAPKNGQYGRVTLPPTDYEDPAKANAAIKKIIEDYWERQGLLEQNVISETFGLNADGKIGRTTAQTSSGLVDTSEQRDWYNSLRDAALGMNDIGENALGKAARPVTNVLKALPEDITEAKVALLWPAANRIRKLKAAHDRAIESGDDYHPNRLASEVVDDIEQFTDVYNNFVIGDQGLSEKEKLAKGPQEEEEIIEASENAAQAIEAAIEHDLFTTEAEESIKENIAEEREITSKVEANTGLSVLEKLARDNTQIAKDNAVRAIIIRVRESEKFGKIEDGALQTIGAGIILYVMSTLPALAGMVMRLFGMG